jgi:hypothetical protein
MRYLYATMITTLTLFMSLIWLALSWLSVPPVRVIGEALLAGRTLSLNPQAYLFLLVVHGLFVGLWTFTLWTWWRVYQLYRQR